MIVSNLSMCYWCRLLRQWMRLCHFNHMLLLYTTNVLYLVAIKPFPSNCHISVPGGYQNARICQRRRQTSLRLTCQYHFWPELSHIISWWTREANIDVMSGMQIFHDDIQPTRSHHWSPAYLPKRHFPKLEGKRTDKHENVINYFSLITTFINLKPCTMLGLGTSI